ncbi:YceK/YidQ family lipoprotein [Methylomonas sp. AM2-LC]|uniref:YceK/YidQ family lipoprotein n=1 Tax=Methylomonas sp. AM2-LC TaxID=3153301 RepID=UPI003264761F
MMAEPPTCGMFFGGVIGDTTEFMMDTAEPWVVAGGVLDLPFSLATDVILAPYDLYQLQKANYVYCGRASTGMQ